MPHILEHETEHRRVDLSRVSICEGGVDTRRAATPTDSFCSGSGVRESFEALTCALAGHALVGSDDSPRAAAAVSEIWDAMRTDVRSAIDLLLEDGFRVVETTSGGMASGLARLSGDGYVDATVSRDRGQWMFDFHLAGKNLDLDAVTAARTGQNGWTRHTGRNSAALKTPDVEWRLEVVAAMDWLRTTSDAAARVEDAQRLRSNSLWS